MPMNEDFDIELNVKDNTIPNELFFLLGEKLNELVAGYVANNGIFDTEIYEITAGGITYAIRPNYAQKKFHVTQVT
jgi:hypothetical protein